MNPTRLRGARTHNLRDVSLEIRPGELVAVTGVSGAGKSSLTLDTLYAEGQRRFVECFSPYARQFLERLERPPVESLDPVAAAVAVDRRAPVKSARSTVATLADVEAYLSGLFLREAVPVCPECVMEARHEHPSDVARLLLTEPEGATLKLSYGIRVAGTADFLDTRERLLREGRSRLLGRDGQILPLESCRPSDAVDNTGHLWVLVDRLKIETGVSDRVARAIDEAWREAGGWARVWVDSDRRTVRQGLHCPQCARGFEPPSAGLFSYQSPVGACPGCRGFGRLLGIDWNKVIPDPALSLAKGAIRPWNGASSEWERQSLRDFCARKGIPLDRPWGTLAPAQQEAVLAGEGSPESGGYPGVRAWFAWMETRTYKMHVRVLLSRYRLSTPCADCDGTRLNAQARGYRVGGLDLSQWHRLEIAAAVERLDTLRPRTGQGDLACQELLSRLRYLCRVGLGYLTLDRQARTLSGGEAQRVSLTAALGSALTGALFVLDEPTVGLHPTDVPPLINAIRELARRGNQVLVVEHDPLVIAAADRVVELGPGAGAQGGHVCFDGPPRQLAQHPELPTGRLLCGMEVSRPVRRQGRGTIRIRGARAHNLQSIDVDLPTGVLCLLTGPSGSGKTTLAHSILYRSVARACGSTDVELPGRVGEVHAPGIKRAELVDQSPLGRTSRGNAATYTKAWTVFRERFAAEPAAVSRGLGASHFSFNTAGGRCETCGGEGAETVEMQFLADVSIPCPACQGRRFGPAVLEVRLRGLHAGEVLALTVDEVLARWSDDADLMASLRPLQHLGLGYLPIGQPLSTLSGGEAQRLKLARALQDPARATLFVIDEPSAGLHAADVTRVIGALQALVDSGASVVVVDHDTALMDAADWIVDLGPGAGIHGGCVVAQGTPEALRRTSTRTAEALRLSDRPMFGSEIDDVSPPPPAAVDTTSGVVWSGVGADDELWSPPPSDAVESLGSVESPTSGTGPSGAIEVRGAREHTLRNVSCDIPLGALVVVTGPSGSGKSSLAFDVVFAEGQRRFLETLTPYARQYLPVLPRPDIERVDGVPPAIALEQRTARAGGTSTVASVTEVGHFLRLLFAKLGVTHCPQCDLPIEAQSADVLWARLRDLPGSGVLRAPAVQSRKGTHLDVFSAAVREGIAFAVVDGERVLCDSPPRLAKTRTHDIDLEVFTGEWCRLDRETLERALTWGRGAVRAVSDAGERLWSTRRTCTRCEVAVPELDPRWLSANTEQGRCPACEGQGVRTVDEAPRRGRKAADPTPAVPIQCEVCHGERLSPVARGVRLQSTRFPDLLALPVSAAREAIDGWTWEGSDRAIGEASRQEVLRRLRFLERVGLGYLHLGRSAGTLSGGEMQRLRLAAQLGSGLTGALYVLDEPTIGLHPRDTTRLIENLRDLVDTGSTVLVVEHDADVIRAADHVIDMGPSGGPGGGRIVAQGAAERVLQSASSPTALALRRLWDLPSPLPPTAQRIRLTGARLHNLQGVDVDIPVGRLTVVSGVSGSGKSSLVRGVLYPALRGAVGLAADDVSGLFDTLEGAAAVRRVLAVDQSPIGRTPRSVPATFLGIWDEIRRLLALTPDAQTRGYTATRFSFNAASGGRCPVCDGQGALSHEMSFLPDVVTPCDACGGGRFDPQTLEVRYRGLSAADLLRLSVSEAVSFFEHDAKVAPALRCLDEMGLGYLSLGQGSHTLSGGEAQRLKLALELTATARHEPTLYVLDEPTTGLHLDDVARLMRFLRRLVDRGDTLVVVEHHPMVLALADHVIELGPEGGRHGGHRVAAGTPEAVSQRPTATGQVLRQVWREQRYAERLADPGGRS